MTTHLYLIRHGDSVSEVVDGKTVELGLSPEGAAQSEKLRDRLASKGDLRPDVLLVSPLRRAQETAALIAPALGQPVVTDSALEEWRAEDGTLSEDDFMAVWRGLPDGQKPFFRFTEGYETLAEFSLRVHAALHRILREHEGKTLAIVSHGGVIQAAFNYFTGAPLSAMPRVGLATRHTSITHWHTSQDGTRWILERFNDYGHL